MACGSKEIGRALYGVGFSRALTTHKHSKRDDGHACIGTLSSPTAYAEWMGSLWSKRSSNSTSEPKRHTTNAAVRLTPMIAQER